MSAGSVTIPPVRVSAKADYAVRAAIEIAASPTPPVKADLLAQSQGIPITFLHKILHELRIAGIIRTQRGPDGGHELARSAHEITVADVLRAVEGPLAEVRGTAPESLAYAGSALPLQRVWIALRSNVRDVLETVTLADVAENCLPEDVDALADREDSWLTR
jgi:Rrf2 family protein